MSERAYTGPVQVLSAEDSEKRECVKAHVLSRTSATPAGTTPFRHLYIEQILPSEFYDELKNYSSSCRDGEDLQSRGQDSKLYQNTRYNFSADASSLIAILRSVFADSDVKQAFLGKFYRTDLDALSDSLSIHEFEFEFTFTEPNRFQNIHLDIPPKYLSFVFYMPNETLGAEDERLNATVLYDKDAQPHHPAKYRGNSVALFAPHFYSAHGNSTTIERPAMVLFYINKKDLEEWNTMTRSEKDVAPYEEYKNFTQRKIERYPLIEYGDCSDKIKLERADCRANAPRARVLRSEDT